MPRFGAFGVLTISFLFSIFLSTSLLALSTFLLPNMPEPPNGPHPGDTLIPGANMNYDQTRLVHAPAAEIWPWYNLPRRRTINHTH